MLGIKKRTMICVVFTVLALCIFCGCTESVVSAKLETPTGVSLDEDDVLTWDAVENASGYLVDLDGTTYETEENELDLFCMITESEHTYQITVQACGDGTKYASSEWSEVYTHSFLAASGWHYEQGSDGLIATTDGMSMEETYKITGKLVLPAEVDGEPVVEIATDCFHYTHITGALLPETLLRVGVHGLSVYNSAGPATLSKIVFQSTESVSIGSDAIYSYGRGGQGSMTLILSEGAKIGDFACGIETEELFLPANVELGWMSFASSHIKKLTVSEGVFMGREAFAGCTLTEVTIAEGVNMGSETFEDCTELTEVTFEGEVDTGMMSFSGCTALTEVYITGDVGLESFANCSSLSKVTFTEAGTESIGSNAFFNTAITEIELPASLKSLGYSAFYGCDISEVTLPEGLTELGVLAFAGSSIKSLHLPASLETIYGGFGIESLTSITLDEGNKAFRIENDCLIRNSDNALVAGLNTSEIPYGVESIEAYAFYGLNELERVTVPETVLSIGSYAFYSCAALESITFEEGVSDFTSVLGECPSLIELNFPSTTRSLTRSTVKNCDGIEILTIAPGGAYRSENNCIIQRDGEILILGCRGSTVPDGVQEIETAVFQDVVLIDPDIVIPSSVTKLGVGVFAGSNMRSVTIEAPLLEKLGDTCFSGCTSLQSVQLGSGLKQVGMGGFDNCTALESISVPGNIEYIGDGAFMGCDAMISATVPGEVDELMQQSFYGLTVYVSAESYCPEGWEWTDKRIDFTYYGRWVGTGDVLTNCTLGYDGIYPYVESYTHRTAEGETKASYVKESGEKRVPCRSGYEFCGWSLSADGSEIDYPVFTDEDGFPVAFTDEEFASLSTGTTLYAVWTPLP